MRPLGGRSRPRTTQTMLVAAIVALRACKRPETASQAITMVANSGLSALLCVFNNLAGRKISLAGRASSYRVAWFLKNSGPPKSAEFQLNLILASPWLVPP
jgi:hypothetical protein